VIPLVQNNVLPVQWTGEVTAALCLAVLGFVVVLILDRMARR